MAFVSQLASSSLYYSGRKISGWERMVQPIILSLHKTARMYEMNPFEEIIIAHSAMIPHHVSDCILRAPGGLLTLTDAALTTPILQTRTLERTEKITGFTQSDMTVSD